MQYPRTVTVRFGAINFILNSLSRFFMSELVIAKDDLSTPSSVHLYVARRAKWISAFQH